MLVWQRRGATVAVVAVLAVPSACTSEVAPETTPTATVSIATAEDYETNMAGCLRERGWEVTITPESEGGGIRSEIPIEQGDAFESDRAECLAEFGYDQPPSPMSEQDAQAYLAKLVEAAECVEGLGYEVPAQPAEQDSLEGLMSVDLDPRWDVFANVPDLELTSTQGTCFPDA